MEPPVEVACSSRRVAPLEVGDNGEEDEEEGEGESPAPIFLPDLTVRNMMAGREALSEFATVLTSAVRDADAEVGGSRNGSWWMAERPSGGRSAETAMEHFGRKDDHNAPPRGSRAMTVEGVLQPWAAQFTVDGHLAGYGVRATLPRPAVEGTPTTGFYIATGSGETVAS